ncbi:MAG: tRNA glutamyl-Q(34) synthetase GluQRS [Gammaproteobacteria bacterium]|nr:tRNA glutamyl-Q(34) synthetase GluQRS [Gammaproteobacteria bacterium]
MTAMTAMTDINKYRGRFAPSPSGPLHFGSLVAALGSYLDARSLNGDWLLRMEDIDPPREKPGAADAILKTLELFGFEWDGPVLYQSSRTEAYREAAGYLHSTGLAYPCSCSRREIDRTGKPGPEGVIYPGTCRNGRDQSRNVRTLRVITDSAEISFSDLIYGRFKQNLEQDVGDFIVRRADGLHAYQLAVVVDDAFQNITRIVRGSDLLFSTPRQIYLQQLLGLPQPEYSHLPLVMNQDGSKLSKQSQAWPVDDTDPLHTLLQAARFLGQIPPVDTPSNLAEFWEWALAGWDSSVVPVQQY